MPCDFVYMRFRLGEVRLGKAMLDDEGTDINTLQTHAHLYIHMYAQDSFRGKAKHLYDPHQAKVNNVGFHKYIHIKGDLF